MPFPALAGDLQLRVLVWVPSRDAFRMGICCRSVQGLLADGRQAQALWQRIAPRDGGAHCHGAIWLHPLAEVSEIREYIERAAVFDVFDTVRFWSRGQISALLAELDHFPRSLSFGAGRCRGKTLFVGRCRFDVEEVATLLRGGRDAPAQSSRVGFVWRDGSVRFDAMLEIAAVTTGGFSLVWKPSFTSDLLMETRDCIELGIRGSIVPMSMDGSIIPSIRAVRGIVHSAESAECFLRHETVCIARVDFAFMGEAQRVDLADVGCARSWSTAKSTI